MSISIVYCGKHQNKSSASSLSVISNKENIMIIPKSYHIEIALASKESRENVFAKINH